MQGVPRHFATALRAARLIRGVTQGQVATATGVPTWRLSSFERGLDVPDPEEFAVVWSFLSSEDDAAGEGPPR